MEQIQDFLKPRSGHRIQQGYYSPKNPHKYIGDITKIVFRSSWEFKFLRFCDDEPNILRYSSEPIAIPYYNPIDHKVHRYYVDFFIEQKLDGTRVQRWLVEVKPLRHFQMPKKPKKESLKSLENYMGAVKRYIVNIEKFKAAKNFAKKQSIMFGVVELNTKTSKFSLMPWEENIFKQE